MAANRPYGGYKAGIDVRGLTQMGRDMRKKVRLSKSIKRKSVIAAGKILRGAAAKALNKKPKKTLKKLEDEGHPYARRHGNTNRSVSKPWYGLYKREGRLLAALRGRTKKEGFVLEFVGFPDDGIFYAVTGTRKRTNSKGKKVAGMVKRNVLWWVSQDPIVRKRVDAKMIGVWKQEVFGV